MKDVTAKVGNVLTLAEVMGIDPTIYDSLNLSI